jgi:hypothetical protein
MMGPTVQGLIFCMAHAVKKMREGSLRVNHFSPARSRRGPVFTSVAEPHHFYAAPAPGKNFDAAPAPTLLYSKAKFVKRTKV